MARIVQFAPALPATTSRLARLVVRPEIPRRLEYVSEHRPHCMNWIAVTDNRGKRRLEMRWVLRADERSLCQSESYEVTFF